MPTQPGQTLHQHRAGWFGSLHLSFAQKQAGFGGSVTASLVCFTGTSCFREATTEDKSNKVPEVPLHTQVCTHSGGTTLLCQVTNLLLAQSA